MTRFLDANRRIFGWGSVFFLLLGYFGATNINAYTYNIQFIYCFFFLLSPILYFVFTIISVSYFSKHGQFEDDYKKHSRVAYFFRCMGTDLVAPFKTIKEFVEALVDNTDLERSMHIRRFIAMMILILFCGFGFLMLM